MGCVSCAGLIKEMNKQDDEIVLRFKETSSTVPIEADSISPDNFISRTKKEIEVLPIYFGRRQVGLGDLFEISGEKADRIVVEGNLEHVKKIGFGMSHGRILIRGTVGQHTGAFMRGGEIVVEGNAGDKAGMNMKGGRLWIKGHAGHLLGAAYPGEKHGVNRGVIVVEGNTGYEAGARMRRGVIVILGDAGDFAGAWMIAGSLFVFGHLGKRAGAGMKRGSIVALGTSEPLLPTYRFESVCQAGFVNIYYRYFLEWGLKLPPKLPEGLYRRYSGDINSLGKGEILIHE